MFWLSQVGKLTEFDFLFVFREKRAFVDICFPSMKEKAAFKDWEIPHPFSFESCPGELGLVANYREAMTWTDLNKYTTTGERAISKGGAGIALAYLGVNTTKHSFHQLWFYIWVSWLCVPMLFAQSVSCSNVSSVLLPFPSDCATMCG